MVAKAKPFYQHRALREVNNVFWERDALLVEVKRLKGEIEKKDRKSLAQADEIARLRTSLVSARHK